MFVNDGTMYFSFGLSYLGKSICLVGDLRILKVTLCGECVYDANKIPKNIYSDVYIAIYHCGM